MKNVFSKVAWLLAALIAVFLFFCIIMAVLSTKAQAQILYGTNGTNVPENLNPETRTAITELLPVGETFVLVFRNDKYTAAAPQSDINNVISLATDLESTGRHFAMVYTFNTRTDSTGKALVTIDQNFHAYEAFTEAGIDILAARMGNEEYFKEAGNGKLWANYQSKFTPVLNELQARSPLMPVIFCMADPSWTAWNTAAANFIKTNARYAADVHLYWGRGDLGVYNQLVNDALPSELSSNTYSPAKDAFYGDMYTQYKESTKLAAVMDWHRANLPGRKMYITEYGPPANPGGLGGALGFEACTDLFLNQLKAYSDIVAIACRFNGPSVTGIITPKNKLDAPIAVTTVERLAYFTLKQFLANKTANSVHTVDAPGTYLFSVHNMTRFAIDFEGYIPLAAGLFVESAQFEAITGANYYSSSGAMAWWANGSTPTYEITGAGNYDYIPALSYGYLQITVKKIPIYGCMDPTASNYNAEATVDDGSCVVITPVCYRKRWLFSSLPCKPAKTNCNCSPSKF